MNRLICIAFACVLAVTPALAQQTASPAKPVQGDAKADKTEKVQISIRDFVGRYVGRGVTRSHGARYYGLADRDLDVVIEETAGGGFTLAWTTIRRRQKDEKRRRTQKVEFVSAGKPNIWKAKTSGDLLAGQPVIWARLAGPRLYVYVVLTDAKTGRFEAAVYVRELVEDGMQLRFRRVRDGAPARSVIAYLRRVK